jgi:hypothetical protein
MLVENEWRCGVYHLLTLCNVYIDVRIKISASEILWPYLCSSFCISTNIMYKLQIFIITYVTNWGTRWRNWLRHCATSRKVAGSIPDGVIGIFHWHKPSCHTMALGLTQPLTEMSKRIFPGGKGGRCARLTNLPPSCADCLEIWEPQLPGTLSMK